MLRLPLLFLLCFSLGSLWVEALDDDDTDEHWDTFKETYNKTYDSPEEEDEARDNFEENLLHVALHNMKDEEDYDKNVHQYSDMSVEDQIEVLCGTDLPLEERASVSVDFPTSNPSPANFNWKDQGKVSPVKDQGGCGSCWAFSAVQALETQAAMRWNGMWIFSEQHLVDCAKAYGNNGCNGGWPQSAFEYLENEGGLAMENDYKYTAQEGSCKNPSGKYHLQVARHVEVGPRGNENAVANALQQKGTLTTAIYVSRDFMHYSSGVFTDSTYKDQGVNHGVLLVGYGSQDGQDYWLIKNSWGPSWGEEGYMKLRRNYNNHLKVASYTSYPELS